MKQGDTAPAFRGQCTDNGIPVPLTGATAKVYIRKPSGAVINGAGTVVEAGVNGWVNRPWVIGDTDEIGEYEIEVEVIFTDGTKQTFPPDDFEQLVVHSGIA
jgi:hypothetical protein